MQYAHAQPVIGWNVPMTKFAFALGFFQLFFIVNVFGSLKFGKKAVDNPWQSPTLEWTAAPTPPLAHGNFETIPSVYRAAYEYSVPGAAKDFIPQNSAKVG
jgi:cytochrome c oxidase subunit 1